MKSIIAICYLLFTLHLAANPEPQLSLTHGPVAHVSLISPDQIIDVEKLTQNFPKFASLPQLQFHRTKIQDFDVLLATYEGDRQAWKKALTHDAFLKLQAHLKPHPRLSPDSTECWVECESICQLRPTLVNEPSGPSQWRAAAVGLKPEKEADYRNLHNRVWPGVVDAIGQANIASFDLFLVEFGPQPYLFYLFEYKGKNFDADMQSMAKDPVNQRWWKFTDACQAPLPEAAQKNEIWTPLLPLSTAKP